MWLSKGNLEEMLRIAEEMAKRDQDDVSALELKLEYPDVLIYEAKNELVMRKESLKASLGIVGFARRTLEKMSSGDDLSSEVKPISVTQNPVLPRRARTMNISEAERQIRRERMKQLWASGRMQSKTAPAM